MAETISSRDFRDVLSRFASGVVVVAAHGDAGPAGLTATAFASASLVPPLVLFCIDKEASAYDAIAAAEAFGVSFLDAAQLWIAKRFAQSEGDRFQGIALRPSKKTRVPLIEGALAHIECTRHALHDAGDHTIVVGEVVAGSAIAEMGRPLVLFGRRFGGFVA